MSGQSVGEALAAYRDSQGLPQGAEDRTHWSVRVGPFAWTLPNWRWRRQAVLAHDIHHMVTGYGFNIANECEMAAWESASGGFNTVGAALVCGGLVGLGMVWIPRRMLTAFRRGAASRNLHHTRIALDQPFGQLAATVSPREAIARQLA